MSPSHSIAKPAPFRSSHSSTLRLYKRQIQIRHCSDQHDRKAPPCNMTAILVCRLDFVNHPLAIKPRTNEKNLIPLKQDELSKIIRLHMKIRCVTHIQGDVTIVHSEIRSTSTRKCFNSIHFTDERQPEGKAKTFRFGLSRQPRWD